MSANKVNRIIECACGCGKKFEEKDKYGRKRKYLQGHGNATNESLHERLIRSIRVNKKNNCWEWTGSLTKAGYGNFALKKIKYLAHRVSYEIFFHVKLKKDECVCHKCDNPRCINPAHLFVGTHLENMHDAIKKGRLGNAKNGLSVKQVSLIRRVGKPKTITQRTIAYLFGVNPCTISRIINSQRRAYPVI